METFKAVEKEMKTKAFSKEGLNAAAKLDPKEKEKQEFISFLQTMIGELEQQIEATEAEQETLQAGVKKGKKDTSRSDRLAELERVLERHKWHVSKLEILQRMLENSTIEVEHIKDLEDGIKYYVEQNQEVDFMEDEGLYDDLNLEEEEDIYGMNNDNDKVSSQDTQSVQDEPPDTESVKPAGVVLPKTKSASQPEIATTTRRPSVQLKAPLPALSTLQSNLSSSSTAKTDTSMKPAPLPSIPIGQTLKYASAAAAAAASEKNAVGISPLPPPPGLPTKTSETASPAISHSVPSVATPSPSQQPAKLQEARTIPPREESVDQAPESSKPSPQPVRTQSAQPLMTKALQPPSPDSGVAGIALSNGETIAEEEEDESIFHLPSSLSDLLGTMEETKRRAENMTLDVPMLNASRLNCPIPLDAEKPNHYKPANPWAYTPAHYPQEPLGIFDDPRLYSRIDTDSLFYAFYYRQGTYQQYLAAKALKSQSWRFHKQYQTWFQRHEEPKTITEEFELGTYRFFDYESTW